MTKILVTGTAGFIGFHLTKRLLEQGFDVVGLDVINHYYDVNLKFDRLKELGLEDSGIRLNEFTQSVRYKNFRFIKADLADHDFIVSMMNNEQFSGVVNLAAQPGVRYSIENPRAYTHSNIDGFLSVLEGARQSKVEHLVYASTSSVYGLNASLPFKENISAEHPIALYAATKKANEMMAHSYSHLFGLPSTGLRFFTVYGPWGRPDMALSLFAEAIIKKEPINIFNHGKMFRDFTYVDDIVESIIRVLFKPPKRNQNWNKLNPEPHTSTAPYQLFNVGNGSPIPLITYVEEIEKSLNLKGNYNMMDIQPGDVISTHADTSELENYIGFKPKTNVEEGVQKFIDWYKKYYNVNIN